MSKSKPPKIDSVQKLAEFWDTHDLSDFEDELEEVRVPVFKRRDRSSAISIPLDTREIEAVERLARKRGISPEELVRSWVKTKIARGENVRASRRSA